MVSRQFWYSQHATLQAGYVTFALDTNRTTHDWCYLTTQKPRVTALQDIDPPRRRGHRNIWGFDWQRVLEQREPGNTLSKSFYFNWPSGARFIWLVVTNTNVPEKNQSFSPIFCYERINNGPVLFQENWLPPSGTNPWTFAGNLPGASHTMEPYLLTLFSRDDPGSATLTLGLPNSVSSSAPIDLEFTFGLGPQSGQLYAGYDAFKFIVQAPPPQPTNGWSAASYFWNPTPPHGTLRGVIMGQTVDDLAGPSHISATINGQRIITDLTDPAGTPIPDPTLARFTNLELIHWCLEADAAKTSTTGFAPIVIQGGQATIVDRSRNWRRLSRQERVPSLW